METLIAIEIDARCARIWRFMAESGVFEIRSGNATLSFDKLGEIRSIKRELYTNFPVDNVLA